MAWLPKLPKLKNAYTAAIGSFIGGWVTRGCTDNCPTSGPEKPGWFSKNKNSTKVSGGGGGGIDISGNIPTMNVLNPADDVSGEVNINKNNNNGNRQSAPINNRPRKREVNLKIEKMKQEGRSWIPYIFGGGRGDGPNIRASAPSLPPIQVDGGPNRKGQSTGQSSKHKTHEFSFSTGTNNIAGPFNGTSTPSETKNYELSFGGRGQNNNGPAQSSGGSKEYESIFGGKGQPDQDQGGGLGGIFPKLGGLLGSSCSDDGNGSGKTYELSFGGGRKPNGGGGGNEGINVNFGGGGGGQFDSRPVGGTGIKNKINTLFPGRNWASDRNRFSPIRPERSPISASVSFGTGGNGANEGNTAAPKGGTGIRNKISKLFPGQEASDDGPGGKVGINIGGKSVGNVDIEGNDSSGLFSISNSLNGGNEGGAVEMEGQDSFLHIGPQNSVDTFIRSFEYDEVVSDGIVWDDIEAENKNVK